MTAHKAQGKTLEAIVVDLDSTSGTEAPYVMLSRATSLDGVFILRPFRLRTIQRTPSPDVREEFRRLDMLSLQTIMRHGTAEESAQAQDSLVAEFSPDALPQPDEMDVDPEVGGAARLARAQANTTRLLAQKSAPKSRSSEQCPTARKNCKFVGEAF
ncbi:hypothetical protein C8F01DRAFT_671014 [Mycena amicta]|nr:hypothetical protein C8F01DRAFT_671014 [Mycena amicta]